MTKRVRKVKHPDLVIAILEAVYRFNTVRGRDWWKWFVNVSDLKVKDTDERIDQANEYADRAGFLRTNGNPASAVVLTPEGFDLLRNRGLT